ncbi:hypothetical protein ACHAWF_011367 [Thalassiosira exigua]
MLATASASASSTASPAEELGGGGSSDDDVAYHLFDMDCAIAVSLLRYDDRPDGDDEGTGRRSPAAADDRSAGGASDLLVLCRKLLSSAAFGTRDAASSAAGDAPRRRRRAICGLVLAARLLRCKLVPVADRSSVWDWAIAAVASPPAPPSSASTTPLEALDPGIASWGLALLRFASSSAPPSRRFPEITRFAEARSVCGPNDSFRQVNQMLATAAIVQMEDALRSAPPRSRASRSKGGAAVATSPPASFLAFARASPRDRPRKKSAGGDARGMVICAPHFLYGTSPQKARPHRLLVPSGLVADYVYDLVDRYLDIGVASTSEGWNPRGWLLAKVQLPCCLPGPVMELLGMKRDYGLELDANLDGCASEDSPQLKIELDANDEEFQRRWKLVFAEENGSTVALVQGLAQLGNCIMISISVSCAVLKHAHSHFARGEAQLSASSRCGADDASENAARLQKRKRKQLDALRRLLQFQVKKIHVMQRICKRIHLVLKGLYAEVCKANAARANGMISKPAFHQSAHERKRISLSEVKCTVVALERFLSSRKNTLGNAVLWSCLNDSAADVILRDTFGGSEKSAEKMSLSSFSRAFEVLCVRRAILRYLALQLEGDDVCSSRDLEEEMKRPDAFFRRGISRVFHMATFLTPCLNVFIKVSGSF